MSLISIILFIIDEIPPLEDMTEVIQKLALTKSNQQNSNKKTRYLEVSKDECTIQNESIVKLLGKEQSNLNTEKSEVFFSHPLF